MYIRPARLKELSLHKKTAYGSNNFLLLMNIGQLISLRSRSSGEGPRRGSDLSELGIVEDAAVLCVGGKVVSIGKTKDALRDPLDQEKSKENS